MDKDKILIPILIYTLTTIGIYALGAFISWEFNPKNWNLIGRMIAACLDVLCCAFSIDKYIELRNK
jgi:hypothetical protein